jgi:hypothetical protein
MDCYCCESDDLSLIDYVEIEPSIYQATFECRQCGNVFSCVISEKLFKEYR